MSQELFEKVGQDLLALARYVTDLEADRDAKLSQAAAMIDKLLKANESLKERLEAEAYALPEAYAPPSDKLRGLEGLNAPANGQVPEVKQEYAQTMEKNLRGLEGLKAPANGQVPEVKQEYAQTMEKNLRGLEGLKALAEGDIDPAEWVDAPRDGEWEGPFT